MKKEEYIHLAQSILEEEYANFLGFEELSERLELHVSYFSRLFKEVLGVSPSQYLNALRVEKSKQLLLEEVPLSNEEIAFQVGYTEANYFTKVFRKYTRDSPKNYRKKYLQASSKLSKLKIKRKVQVDDSQWL